MNALGFLFVLFSQIANGLSFGSMKQIDENDFFISNAVSKIIQNVAPRGSLGICISVASSDSKKKQISDGLLKQIVSENNQSTFLVQNEKYNQFYLQATSKYFNIFLVDSYESFQKIFNVINQPKFDYEGKFLIVLTLSNAHYPLTERIFKDLWKIYITHADILVRSPNENVAYLYTFFPFTKQFCDETQPVLLKTFKDGEFFGPWSIFPEKVRNMYDCPVNVGTFVTAPFMIIHRRSDGSYAFDGMDGKLLTMLSERMHFNINLTVLPVDSLRWGSIYPNGSSKGALGLVRSTISHYNPFHN